VWGEEGTPTAFVVDPRHVVIERMGARYPGGDDLTRIFRANQGRLSKMPGFSSGWASGCHAGGYPGEGSCITLGITTEHPELSALMKDVAEVFSDVGDTCVPVIINAGQAPVRPL
jgi:hypothetical protein